MFVKLSGKLKRIVLGFGFPRLPIMMADDKENHKDKIKYAIIYVLTFLAVAKTVSNLSDLGHFVLEVFNNTAIKVSANVDYVTPVASTLGSVFEIFIVMFIIIGLLFVIKYLMKSTDSF
jgi:hypothetical protein